MMIWPGKMPFSTMGADMARPSRKGGKTRAAKTRKAGPAKDHKPGQTQGSISPAATRVKRPSVSRPSEEMKETPEQQAGAGAKLKVIAKSPSHRQPVFDA